MLSLPGYPVINKAHLIGACDRLPLRLDAMRLQAETGALPESLWGTQGGRGGYHNVAETIFFRGYAPAQGDLPIEDRETLALVPYVREIIYDLIPAPPMRCLLACLPGGAIISPHEDRADYFRQTLRIHIPVMTHPKVKMYCAGLVYTMRSGEVWALNNNAIHAVWNADRETARIHLICDFLPTPALIALLLKGERDLGQIEPDTEEFLAQYQTSTAAAG